jgi:predicted TIM-barrel fold metal-dependent hydrolase
VRFSLASFFGTRFDADGLNRSIAAIEPLSWVVTLLLDGDMIERHAEVIRKIPLPTVLDALGGVDVSKSTDQPAFRALCDLAALPHVWVKIIGVDRSTARPGAVRTPSASRPMNADYGQYVEMARAIAAVAPDRIIWGTDWPHAEIFEPGLMPDDGDLLDMLLDFAPETDLRRRILADNPKRLFDF